MRSLADAEEYVLTAAAVLTMDDSIGDLVDGSVHVRKGEIIAVGEDVTVPPGVPVFDFDSGILIPGFVDTHWHLWNSILRGYSWSELDISYMKAKRAYAPHYTPDRTYRATKLALAEGLLAGITTVHNWNHNVRSVADATASIAAQRTMGVRGRFAYGPQDSQDPQTRMEFEGVESVLRDIESSDQGMLSLGVALRGPYRGPREVWSYEWAAARDLGLPITMHCDRCAREEGCRECGLSRLATNGLLGSDVQLVHVVHASDDDIRIIAETGTHVSLSPVTEMRSMGFPRATELLQAGVPVSLSTDSCACPTAANPFEQMRVLLSVERSRMGERTVTPRRALQLATRDGAEDLGLGDITGSIRAGKRADLVVLRADDPNMLPCVDPLSTLVLAGGPSNVEAVMVDGKLRVWGGEVVGMSREDMRAESIDLFEELTSALGWPAPPWSWLSSETDRNAP